MLWPMPEASPRIGRAIANGETEHELARQVGAGQAAAALRLRSEAYAPASVQEVVDQLSAKLDRAIAIDDQHLRLVAFSVHPYGVDTVRLDSILNRQASPQVSDWAHSHAIRDADPYIRIPENGELDMRPRVCIPIRHNGIVLGYLWLIEEFRILSDAELEIAVAAAAEAAPIMHVERTLLDRRRQRERELLFALLADGGALASTAAQMALAEQIIQGAALYTVIVIGPSDAALAPTAAEASRALGALHELRRRLAPQSCIAGVLDQRGIMLLGTSDLDAIHVAVKRLTEVIANHGLVSWRIAVGSQVDELESAARSFQTALNAMRVAMHTPDGELGPVWWSRMPAWRLLSCLADDEVTRDAIHPAIANLKADRHGDVLLTTLETYLDNGGDARATAEKLYMHRTSLYSRLQRIEAIAGVNLHDGEDRLALHISLRVARLVASSDAAAIAVKRS
jgi:hypothetical protein